ncbi:hypothetical protein N7454_002775 [Penicillium verhagenii]|nr:hypothetical protein N7454_002775 [Penicillium verhagenii]
MASNAQGRISDYFNRPKFAKLNQDRTPEKKRFQQPRQPSSPESPLTEPTSSWVDLTSEEPCDGPSSQLKSSLIQSVDSAPSKPTPSQSLSQSFQSIKSTDEALPKLSKDDIPHCQRIIKGGKQVVISSDGEETDSDDSDFDPMALLGIKSKQTETPVPAKMLSAPRQIVTTVKKYRNNIHTLVNDAKTDSETEANVAKAKATLDAQRQIPGTHRKTGLSKDVLTSALGGDEDDDGVDARRLFGAIERTDALARIKVWRFLSQTRGAPVPFEFPMEIFPHNSQFAALREPDSRERIIQSGMLEFAASWQRLPDEFIMWLFHSLPLEPREELRQAYVRILTATPKEPDTGRIKSLIRPSNIDEVFGLLGAKTESLDFSKAIVEDDRYDPSYEKSALKDRGALLSLFDLLREAAKLFAKDTREHAIQVLLRITLDTAITADYTIRSELESCIGALLQSVAESDIEEMETQICATLYKTLQDSQCQSRMLQHILPTTVWISRLRYRLAMAFLLRSPAPLTEPIQDILDLKRLTYSLIGDKRFQVRTFKSEEDYDELTSNSMLLEICINTCLYDLSYRENSTAKEFNEAVDKLAVQIKRIFSSIENTGGARYLKRLFAKGTLELIYHRMLHSVRSKPQPKKHMFTPYAKTTKGNIKTHFKSRVNSNPSDETLMPIRRHESS